MSAQDRSSGLAIRSLAALALLAGSGCASVSSLRGSDIPDTGIRTSWESAGIEDARSEFQAVFCAQYAETGGEARNCQEWSWHPAGAPALPTAAKGRVPDSARKPTLVIIPGILGECVDQWVTPFSDGYEALRRKGYNIHVVKVTGRGSSAQNARQIHAYMLEHGKNISDAVVVAYSKGLSDFMLALTQPEAAAWRAKVGGLVSVAGTANGSPLANQAAGLYERVLKSAPWSTCKPADGGGVRSISYRQAMQVRRAFLAMPDRVPVYSIAAVTSQGRANPVLSPFVGALSAIDDRNDGQLLLEDAVLPGSVLLGIYHADHWSISLPFESSDAWQVKALGTNNHFPRQALIEALMLYVPARLAQDHARGAVPPAPR